MTNTLEKFQKNVIGSKNVVIDYNNTISSAGDFSRVINVEAILNSWNNILLTSLRSYVANPEYGSNLYKYVFDPEDEVTIEAIKSEVQYRLMLYDNRAMVTSINVIYMANRNGFVVNIDLKYKGEKASMSVEFSKKNALRLEG